MKHLAALIIGMLTLAGSALAQDANVRQINDYVNAKYSERDVGGRPVIASAKDFVDYFGKRFGKPMMVGSGKDKDSYGWLIKVKNDSFNNCVEVALSSKKSALTYPLDVGIGKCDASRLERLGYKVTGEIDNANK